MEPGTKVEIHRHPTKDESFVLLRGRVRVNTYNDGGTVIESIILCPEEGLYGVDIPKNVWHNVECQNANAVKVGVLIFLLTEVICTPVTTTLEYVTTKVLETIFEDPEIKKLEREKKKAELELEGQVPFKNGSSIICLLLTSKKIDIKVMRK